MKCGEFFSIRRDISLATRRTEGNALAYRLLKKADKVAGLLYLFPFVKGLAVSGSLSKNYADEYSDIDFFIITNANRLWIARTLMHLFKKLTFLANKQHLYCMNYYVDTAGLTIEEKNIYTAIEISTLLPLRGHEAFHDFSSQNAWVKKFLPNHTMKVSYMKQHRKPLLINMIQIVLNLKLFDWLEYRLMKLTEKRWRKKELMGKSNSHQITLSMRCGKHYSKPDPRFFQDKLVQRFDAKVSFVMAGLDEVPTV